MDLAEEPIRAQEEPLHPAVPQAVVHVPALAAARNEVAIEEAPEVVRHIWLGFSGGLYNFCDGLRAAEERLQDAESDRIG